MLATEAQQARITLGLSLEDLAAEAQATPDIVATWESGRIRVPKRVAIDLRWRLAVAERQRALVESGLPECEWVSAFENEPEPDDVKAYGKHLDRLLAHAKSCRVCKARDDFIAEKFGAMPPAPRPGWVGVVAPVVERIQGLPPWARPAAGGAALFVAYSLFRLIFLIPSIVHAPGAGLLTAATGIAASASVGAVLGLAYGAFQRLRKRAVNQSPSELQSKREEQRGSHVDR